MARKKGPTPEDEAPQGEAEERVEGLRWEIGRAWTLPSAEEIERRFDELIRHRWAGEPASGVSWLAVEREVWVELDLPGVEKREIRARLEVRSESGGWRVRIRQSELREAAREEDER